jgi:hypothetical protein
MQNDTARRSREEENRARQKLVEEFRPMHEGDRQGLG